MQTLKENSTKNEENQGEIPGRYEDFIGIYDNALSPEFCDAIIEAFDHYHQTNAVWCENDQFENTIAGRFDWALDLSHMSGTMVDMPERDLNDVLMSCLSQYTHKYGHLAKIAMYSTTQKIQKTPAGGGYHVWHDENSTLVHASRKVVWMFYLNDDFEGGETEFLYYHKRIVPKRGTLLLWPAGMTHAHRGGLVTKGMKYVVTGWFHVAE
tara:strand:- start:165 stop:794 length:630 start_codon:yes stop_codon:yes gene_type:complete